MLSPITTRQRNHHRALAVPAPVADSPPRPCSETPQSATMCVNIICPVTYLPRAFSSSVDAPVHRAQPYGETARPSVAPAIGLAKTVWSLGTHSLKCYNMVDDTCTLSFSRAAASHLDKITHQLYDKRLRLQVPLPWSGPSCTHVLRQVSSLLPFVCGAFPTLPWKPSTWARHASSYGSPLCAHMSPFWS